MNSLMAKDECGCIYIYIYYKRLILWYRADKDRRLVPRLCVQGGDWRLAEGDVVAFREYVANGWFFIHVYINYTYVCFIVVRRNSMMVSTGLCRRAVGDHRIACQFFGSSSFLYSK